MQAIVTSLKCAEFCCVIRADVTISLNSGGEGCEYECKTLELWLRLGIGSLLPFCTIFLEIIPYLVFSIIINQCQHFYKE